MPDTGVGLMARFPIAGEVKTRLARTIGHPRATEIYRTMLNQTIGELTSLSTGVFATTIFSAQPELVAMFHNTYPALSSVEPQIGNDLGERMLQAVMSLLSPPAIQHAILIGPDIPHLTAAHIKQARTLLQSHDLVLGPTTDGGYYLIGMNKPHQLLFTEMEWSTSLVFSETVSRASRLALRIATLEQLQDLDTEDDLAAFPHLARLAQSESPVHSNTQPHRKDH